MSHETKNLSALFEAMLFSHGDPISAKKLAVAALVSEAEAKGALAELSRELEDRGIVLIEKDGEWQLGTNPKFAAEIETLMKREFSEELSRAALEVLAIIAYKGPITRVEIEYVRGVNSSFSIRNLLLRGLVERNEHPHDARTWLYRVSFDFLKYLGLTRIEDLPQFSELHKSRIEILEEGRKTSDNGS